MDAHICTVSAEQKTPDSGPPHYLEDEGLYVGERPHVLWTNQVAMENRLLRRKDKVRCTDIISLFSSTGWCM